MSTGQLSADRKSSPELVWIGDGAWVARDTRLAENDPHRVVAYLECKDHRVYVLWVRGRRDVSCFNSLREALTEIAASAGAFALEAAGPS
ncbi:hypothetical protein NQ152_06250 [Microbacterium sp. zg.B48]|uniref:hypothetical protein n=1 Tax=Microbacterium sp. zg.B48 TaxID=2969408 RepID=UPI00214B7D69|nr:hypothetical protein [Microbacterium sp. zg.B48]MCR2763111.1 hypothetical protein [Microbacterium sp. zg.B48]